MNDKFTHRYVMKSYKRLYRKKLICFPHGALIEWPQLIGPPAPHLTARKESRTTQLERLFGFVLLEALADGVADLGGDVLRDDAQQEVLLEEARSVSAQVFYSPLAFLPTFLPSDLSCLSFPQ